MTSKRSYKHLAVAALSVSLAALLSDCAAVGTPDGGAYDETPPRVTGSNPKMEETGVKGKKVTIDFNEFIKLENASEKVVISPPQAEQPEIKVNGKKIQIELIDSLKPNTTYSIDFADGIVDNNEGNPLGDFCFRFSTGDSIDTLEVSGYVLDAEDLEPVSGMTVGLYKDLADSAFETKPFDRVARTDSRGHFTIRGVAPGEYRAFAVMDMDGTFNYSARNEMVAWYDSIIVPYSRPDVRTDSIFNDDGEFDSLRVVDYIHYFPDDIVLLASTAKPDIQYLARSERDKHEKFSLQFALPMDSMPEITGINFNADSAYVLQHSIGFDTLTFWMRDTSVYYMDTLSITVSYLGSDTLGQLVPMTDTLDLVPKESRATILAKLEKEEKEKAEELEKKIRKLEKNQDTLAIQALLEPEPPVFLPVKLDGGSSISVYKQIKVSFDQPVEFLSDTAVHVFEQHDSLWDAIPFEFTRDSIDILTFMLDAEWQPGQTYNVRIDSASILGIWGQMNTKLEEKISFAGLEEFSTLTVNFTDTRPGYTVCLISDKKIVRQAKLEPGSNSIDFFLLKPGDYFVSMFDDVNGNGIWDTGDWYNRQQPESTYYINRKFTLKADWYHETEPWNVSSEPLVTQKPADLSEAKTEKAKADTHKKNVERLEKKATQIQAQKKKKEQKEEERKKRREEFKAMFKFL